MTEVKLLGAIAQKYILPTMCKRKKCIGVEFEFPIVNCCRETVDFSGVHCLTDAFVSQFDFCEIHCNEEGMSCSAVSLHNGDDLSYERKR